jgi:hypothetical protein
VVGASALVACSTSSAPNDASAGGCRKNASTASLTSPTVAFRRDVVPILQNSCSIGSSCHGQPTAVAEQRPFLGYTDADAGATDYAAVLAAIVGVKSKEDLSMNLVTAGDPSSSFLMHKLDDDQCTMIPACDQPGSFRPNCGVFMPYQAPDLLNVATRDTVRRWIAQGARND